MFKISEKYPLLHQPNIEYCDITYDGSKIYLCTNGKQIIKLDTSFTFLQSVSTDRSYHTLCYDNANQCFWAASSDAPGILYKLSDALKIDTEIRLFMQEDEPVNIDFLFYDAAAKRLFASNNSNIYAISDSGELGLYFELKEMENNILKICVLSDRFMCLYQSNEEIRLRQFSRSDIKLSCDDLIMDVQNARSVTMTQNHLTHPDFSLLLLGENQEHLPVLFELKQEVSDVQIQQVRRFCMQCPFRIEPPRFPRLNIPFSVYPPPCNSCSPEPDCCNDNCVNYPDQNCCIEHPPCCTEHPSCCHHQACTQVIESIALTETSIAHILNAEGEKLQKAIACCTNVNELLKVNDSVLRTIIQSTHLEQVLFQKLDAVLQDISCGCSSCEPGFPCPLQESCHMQNLTAPEPADQSENNDPVNI